MDGSESTGWKPGQSYTFLNGPATEAAARFSPDGNWLAYESDESGTFQVYVRPFPGPGGKWQISTDTGFSPVWARDVHELLYLQNDGKVMAVHYSTSANVFQADKPRLWTPANVPLRGPFQTFDVSADGKRIAVRRTIDQQPQEKQDRVTIVFNFADELRRIAPAKK
jgi:serine/threonine-protein kinase